MISHADELFINECIARCETDSLLFGRTVLPGRGANASFGVMVWNPIKAFNLGLVCPIHSSELKETKYYVNNSRKGESPRLLFDSLRVCLLVSAKYKCSECTTHYLAHDENLLQQIGHENEVPFLLYHKNAATKTAFYNIFSSITSGILGSST